MTKLQTVTKLAREPEEHEHAECRAAAQVLDRIGDKWTVMVVGTLSKGPMRFNAVMRAIGGCVASNADAYAARTGTRRIGQADCLSDDSSQGRVRVDRVGPFADWAVKDSSGLDSGQPPCDRGRACAVRWKRGPHARRLKGKPSTKIACRCVFFPCGGSDERYRGKVCERLAHKKFRYSPVRLCHRMERSG